MGNPWTSLYESTYTYESAYNLQECINLILEEPQRYRCQNGGELWYRAEQLSDTEISITFRGGQFRRMAHTKYLMKLSRQENHTKIILHFQKEFWGLPPMTLASDIDLFMKQKLNAVRESTYTYESAYDLQECINRILEEPQQYICHNFGKLRYKTEQISDTEILITFRGGKLRRMVRTQYLMKFSSQENHTKIVLHFQKELWGLSPMTPPSDIDLCMKQKLNAIRKC